MKTLLLAGLIMVAALAVVAQPTVYSVSAPRSTEVYVYDQKPLAGFPELIPVSQAQTIVERFKTNLFKLDGARILIHVNHELGSNHFASQIIQRNETKTVPNVAAGNSDLAEPPPAHPPAQNINQDHTGNEAVLTDRQTMREVERLMGRPLRAAGADLIDFGTAERLSGELVMTGLAGQTEQAGKNRAAVGQVADVVVEVLMSWRQVVVPELAGDKIYSAPDIQMTAIRLKDAKILGQASASEVINRNDYAARNFGVEAITEATTLALMDNMVEGGK